MQTIALDNETHLITRLKPAPKVVCTSFYDGFEMEDALLVKAGPELLGMMHELLRDPNICFVGHNIAYDFATFAATYPELLDLIFDAYAADRVTDTAIRQQLFDTARGLIHADDRLEAYSLYSLAMMIFGEKMEGKNSVKDDWRLRYAELENVPLIDWPKKAVDYSKSDSIMTWRVWNAQNEAQDEIRDEYSKAFSFWALALMQNRGMRTNANAVKKCREQHEKRKAKIAPKLIKSGLLVFEGKKGVKKKLPAQERIYNACKKSGVPVPLTDKGREIQREGGQLKIKHVSTDKAACLTSGDALMLQRSKYGTAEKMLSTYIPVAEAGISGPVTTRFALAATGRTTSSAPRLPLIGDNRQNAPREGGVRECYYPRPGMVYLAADFSGAELHTFAQACKDSIGYSTLGDRLNAGEDVHLYLASRLLGISEQEAVERYAAKDKEVENARQDAKPGNFGYLGGMREKTFMRIQLLQRERFWTFEEAHRLRETWLEAFPEMSEYFDFCGSELGPYKDCVIEVGKSKRLRRVHTLPVCANTKFQGPAADGALEALNTVSFRCYCDPASYLYGARPCNFIHDEILSEISLKANLHEAALEKKEIMETEFSLFTPDYPVEVEPVLMAYWSKKAKAVYDEKGRLTIWAG